MTALVDTNILVYRFDSRFPDKQEIATESLRRGIAEDSIRVPLQAVVEFVAAVTRSDKNGHQILGSHAAWREADEMLYQFDILYPNEEVLRTAIRGAATYQLSWFDAHLWAYAEVFSLPEILSEDFEDGRRYGTVSVVNPFSGIEAG